MKKASDSQTKLILLLLALLLLAGSYFFVYKKYTADASALEQQNVADKATVTTLEDMVSRRPQVEAETAAYKEIIQNIIKKYPSDLPTEKVISIVQNTEDFSGIHVNDISFQMDNLVMNFTQASEEIPVPPTGYMASLGISYVASYDGLKSMVDYIGRQTDRMVMPAVSATYDPMTDLLTGSITYNFYYLKDVDKAYIPPVVPDSGKGVESIFGAGDGILMDQFDAENPTEDGDAAAQ